MAKTSSKTKAHNIDPQVITENLARVTDGAEISLTQLTDKSPVKIPEFGIMQTTCLIEHLFTSKDNLHLTWQNRRTVKGERAHAMDPGGCAMQTDILNGLRQGVFQTMEGGYLYTIHPVTSKPSGKSGAVCDVDCVAWKYLLIECDDIPIPQQAALLGVLHLPIRSIVTSGGRSLHAIVELNAKDWNHYKELAGGMMNGLRLLGFDSSCCNPSRKSRLPGFTRRNLSDGSLRRQELIYLNTGASAESIL